MFEGKLNSDGLPEWTRKGMESEMDPEPFYIVAANLRMAVQFARSHAIYPRHWRYVEDANTLKGAHGKLIYATGWYNRQDIMKIKEMASIGIETGTLKVVELDE